MGSTLVPIFPASIEKEREVPVAGQQKQEFNP